MEEDRGFRGSETLRKLPSTGRWVVGRFATGSLDTWRFDLALRALPINSQPLAPYKTSCVARKRAGLASRALYPAASGRVFEISSSTPKGKMSVAKKPSTECT